MMYKGLGLMIGSIWGGMFLVDVLPEGYWMVYAITVTTIILAICGIFMLIAGAITWMEDH